MDQPWVLAVIAALATMFTSGGFWAWLVSKNKKQTAVNQLLLGLAYDRIMDRGMLYIEKKWISKDEYEDFVKLFYDPYIELGGNGLAKKMMQDIQQLEMRGPARYVAIDHAGRQKAEVINEHR